MNASRPNSSHVALIDLLRFLAAGLVLLSHLSFAIATRPDLSPYQLSDGLVTTLTFPALGKIGWIGVQIFFVISGLVISYSAHATTPYAFMRSRLLRLLPAAWICATITAVFMIALPGNTTWTWTGYRHSVLMLPWGPWVDSVYWTLPIEICFYIAIGWLVRIKNVEHLGTLAKILTFQSLVYWILFTVARRSPGSPLASMLVDAPYAVQRGLELLLFKHGCFFAIGIVICEWLVRKQPRPSLLFLFTTIPTGLLQIYWNTVQAAEKANHLPSPILPMTLWSASLGLIVYGINVNSWFSTRPTLGKLLRSLGLMTYPLYLVHQNVGAILMKYLLLAGLTTPQALLAAVAGLLAMCWLIFQYAEPLLRHTMARILDRITPAIAKEPNTGAQS